jgi:enediyne biosynthesis protein E4
VLLADVEPDGDVDIYVANDTTDNFLYLNDGNGRFADVGIARGVALDDRGIPNGSMGVELCDYNQDGLPDLWVANYEDESFALYRNEGGGNFLHVSQRLGITDLGGLFVGFGTACEDFDADGDQDFVVTNGHVIKYPVAAPRRQLPLLLEYDGRRFTRARFEPGSFFEQPHEGRGLAVADFDADGDLDLAISHLNEPLALLRNEFHPQNRWLSLNLIGTVSCRDAVGTRVELQVGDRRWQRQVVGGGSYLSHHSRDVHFVLPDGDAQRKLTIHWSSGGEQSFDASSLTGRITLIEPRAGAPISRGPSPSGVAR